MLKKFLVFSLLLVSAQEYIYTKELEEKLEEKPGILLNETRAALTVVAPTPQTFLITSLDIRPGVDGVNKTIRDVVLDQIMVCESQKLPMPMPENQEDLYLNSWQQQFGITRQQILDHFKQELGFSEDELREELKKRAHIDRLLDFKVRTHKDMYISQEEKENYWRENPKIEEGSFTLAEAIVKSDEESEALKKNLKEHPEKYNLSWGKPFTVLTKDMPLDKLFIGNYNPEDIVLVEPGAHGFEVTKLVEKKEPAPVSFKEREPEISGILRGQRYDKILKEYQRDLLEEYKPRINFMHEDDRKQVYGE